MPTNRKGYKIAYYRREREKIIAQLGGQCLKCGCTENLEIHHIRNQHKEICSGAGQSARLTEWKQNINNLSLLCYEHHKEYHFLVNDDVNFYTLFNYISGHGSLNKDAIPF